VRESDVPGDPRIDEDGASPWRRRRQVRVAKILCEEGAVRRRGRRARRPGVGERHGVCWTARLRSSPVRAAGWAAPHALPVREGGRGDRGERPRWRAPTAPAAATRWPTRFVKEIQAAGGQAVANYELGPRPSRAARASARARSTRFGKVDILVNKRRHPARQDAGQHRRGVVGHRDPGAPEGHLLRDPPRLHAHEEPRPGRRGS